MIQQINQFNNQNGLSYGININQRNNQNILLNQQLPQFQLRQMTKNDQQLDHRA